MSVIVKKIGSLYRDMVTLELKRRLNECQDIFMLNYHKVTSGEMTRLRKDLKGVGASVLVTKNSFMRKVFQELKKSDSVATMVDGPMALIFVKDDLVAASKVLMKFAKDHEALQIQGGFLAERIITLEDIKRISKLPSRQVLYQQVASTLNAPLGKLAMSLNQIVAKLAYAISAVNDKKK